MPRKKKLKWPDMKCKHRHTIRTHPQCFHGDKLIDESFWYENLKVGSLDIESTGFKANFDFMLSWALKEHGPKGKLYYDIMKPKEFQYKDVDKRITRSLLKAIADFDVLVTYYGTGFDIPFIRTRSLKHGLRFPSMGEKKHIDVYYTVRSKLKLHRSSLDAATTFLGIEGKTHLEPDQWFFAKLGNKKALKYVLTHNKEDVFILERLFNIMKYYTKYTKRSL